MAEHLPRPVKQVLAAPAGTEAATRRVRDRLEARLDTPRLRPVRIVALAFAAVFLLAVGYGLGRLRSGGETPVAHTTPEPVHWVTVADRGTMVQTLSDQSRVELAPDSSMRLVEGSPERIVLSLEQGSAHFVVSKHPERLFRVEAGNVTATVRGTAFRVTRQGEGAVVSVDEGQVEVTSAAGSRWLAAGEQLGSVPEIASTATVRAPPLPSAGTPRAPALGWRAMAAEGDYPAAYVALGAGGVGRESGAAVDAATLFSLADVARLSGHPAEATAPLEKILAAHRGDPSASLAAFTLGKLQLDQLADPRAAAGHFDQAIALGAPATILEDATARRVQAYARAGDGAKARAAAAEYRARFPAGRYEAEVTQWSAP